MAHNPYTPPDAPVTNIGFAPAPPRPWQLKAALGIMSLALLVTLLNVTMRPVVLTMNHDETLEIIRQVVYLLMFALLVVLVVCTGRGHRWARIVYSALAVMSLVGALGGLPASFPRPRFDRVLYLLSITADSATVVLLFTPASNARFRRRAQVER